MMICSWFLVLLLAASSYGGMTNQTDFAGADARTLSTLEFSLTGMPSMGVPGHLPKIQELRVSSESKDMLNDGLQSMGEPSDVVVNYMNASNSTMTDVLVVNESEPNVANAEILISRALTNESLTAQVPTPLLKKVLTVQEGMTLIIMDSKVICQLIHNISYFSTTVLRSVLLRKSLKYQTRYNAYIEQYNQDLLMIKDHMSVWRVGDSINTEIKSVYKLVKGFEAEFVRKFHIYKNELNSVPSRSDRRINGLKEDIKRLNESIQASYLKIANKSEGVKAHLQRYFIAGDEGRLTEMEQKLQLSSLSGIMLEETVAFLEFVIKDCKIIKEKAERVILRLKELQGNVQIDHETLHLYILNVTNDVSSLRDEENSFKGKFLKNNNRTEELESEKDKINSEIDDFNKEINKILLKAKDVNEKLKKKRESFEEQKTLLCQNGPNSTIQTPDDWNSTACEYYLYLQNIIFEDVEVIVLNKELSDLKTERDSIIAKISTLMSQFDMSNQEIIDIEDSVPSDKRRIEQIQAELWQFEMYQMDMNTLIEGINFALPNMSVIQNGLQRVFDTFRLINENLHDMIKQGRNTATEEGRTSVMAFIEEALSSLQKQIDGSYQKMSSLRECSLMAFFP